MVGRFVGVHVGVQFAQKCQEVKELFFTFWTPAVVDSYLPTGFAAGWGSVHLLVRLLKSKVHTENDIYSYVHNLFSTSRLALNGNSVRNFFRQAM